MNIRDPLWPSNPSKQSSSNSTTASQTSSAANKLIQLFAPVSNIALAAITPSSSTSGESSTAVLTTVATTSVDQASFSQNQTDALISAISSSGPHLWSFKSFWYIAAAVTAITILLLIIAGPVSRWTLRSIFHYKNYWRAIVLVLGLGVIIALSELTYYLVSLVVFSVPQGLLGLWLLYRAWKTNKGKVRFTAYMTILVVCIFLDLNIFASFSFTGILPPLYLFIVWIQEDIRRFFAPALEKIGERFGHLRMPRIVHIHPTRCFLFLLLRLEGVNIAMSYICLYYVGYLVYMTAIGIRFGLYGIDKLITAFQERQQKYLWMAYLTVVGVGQALDWWTAQMTFECEDSGFPCENPGFYGWTALGSGLFLVLFHYRVKIRAFWRTRVRHLERQPELVSNGDLESR